MLNYIFSMWLCLGLTGSLNAASPKSSSPVSKKNVKIESELKTFDLETATFKDVLDHYLFVADFNQKPAERPISKEFFWKYPFKLPPVDFELNLENKNLSEMIFQIKGEGRLPEAFNVGRVAFMSGDYLKAHSVWLATRQEFKDDASINKLLEFFMGVNALAAYKQKIKEPGVDSNNLELKAFLQRAAYFFASSFILRRDVKEDRIDPFAPWALYNLSVIYYKFSRIPSSYGAAEEGLAALLKQGKNERRSELRQILAEAYLKNQDMISAIQELDTAIRQDPDPVQASKMFSRAADIYYDLNNYELAQDLYSMASAVDRQRRVFNVGQALLRAESEFWLGNFEKAEKLFQNAIQNSSTSESLEWLNNNNSISWAMLRVGDTLLARSAILKGQAQKTLLEKARLAYFKLQTEFPKSEASVIADVRGACMDMPMYQGNNVKHARELLADVKEKKSVPEVLMELIWACDASSYSERESTDLMVSKVQEFAEKYPQSRFLEQMISPVRTVQASKIQEYFKKRQWSNAVSFFEQRRTTLFPKVSKELADQLWIAYVTLGRSKEALQFWVKPKVLVENDVDLLREAAFYFEVTSDKKNDPIYQELHRFNDILITHVWQDTPNKEQTEYLERILASKNVALAYPWILKLQQVWTKDDEMAPCTVLYPFLSRVYEDKRSTSLARSELYKQTKDFTATKLKGFKDKDKACFQSWIDFEAKILNLKDLEENYAGRSTWSLEGPWLERYWLWSEELASRNQHEEARKIWEKIALKGPSGSFEVKMAKSRLDKTKTEFESIWK